MKKAKNLIIASYIIFASSIFSAMSCGDDTYNYKFNSGYPVDEDHMIGAYNAQGRIDVCGKVDLFTSGAFLLWQPKEQGLDIALVTPTTDPTNNVSHNLNSGFNYDPGFKITIGSFFSEDNWGAWVDYSRFHTTNRASRNVDTAVDTINNYWRMGTPVSDISSLFSKWDMDLDIIDLSLGRPYYVGTKLIFKPFIGGNAGWLDQEINISYTAEEINYETTVSSNSWLIGPRLGIKTSWLLAEGFRFFGDSSASIFYQSFDLVATELSKTDPTNYTTNAKDSISTINTCLDLSLGFGWGTYFAHRKLHLDLLAGYELQVMWNQNEARAFVEEIKNQVSSKPGNLTPHGFIFAMRLDF